MEKPNDTLVQPGDEHIHGCATLIHTTSPFSWQTHLPNQLLLILQNPSQTIPLLKLPEQSQQLLNPLMYHHYTWFYAILLFVNLVIQHICIKSLPCARPSSPNPAITWFLCLCVSSIGRQTSVQWQEKKTNWIKYHRTNELISKQKGPSLQGKQMMEEKWKQWRILFPWAPKSLWTMTAAMKLKETCSLEGKLWQN